MVPSITQAQINTALGNFLTTILPSGTTVIVGQVNRVASPEGDYVVMWPLLRPRLSTNVDSSEDCAFTASISTTNMTVTQVGIGIIELKSTVFGPSVAAGTVVQSQTSGTPGGPGVYVVNNSQTVSSEIMQAGQLTVLQSTEVVMQLDVHGLGASENAQTISTLFRDTYAVQQMSPSGVIPLYTGDPKQVPFQTAANQYETRWIIEAHLEIDPTVAVPQEYADQAVVGLVSVETVYPPT